VWVLFAVGYAVTLSIMGPELLRKAGLI